MSEETLSVQTEESKETVGKPSFRERFLNKKNRPGHPRLHTLDEIRGLALLCMIAYHTIYDLVCMYNVPLDLYNDPFLIWFQRGICCTFIFLSGLSARLSRNTARRGCIVFGCAVILTLVTAVFLPEFQILFGVLHLIGCCMILFVFLRPLLNHVNPWVTFGVFFLLFIVFFHLPSGYIGISGLIRITLPSSWYRSPYLFFLGLPHPSFWSADYFPLIPWMFLFLSGSGIGRLAEQGKFPEFFKKLRIPPLAFIGRWTLPVYMIHQPVIYGVLLLLDKIGIL